MAPPKFLPLFFALLVSLVAEEPADGVSIKVANDEVHLFNCSAQAQTCNASLYYHNNGVPVQQISQHYSVNASRIQPMLVAWNKRDYLISVPCSCQTIQSVTGYFYNTSYPVQQGNTFLNISAQYYDGQAYSFGDEDFNLTAFSSFPIYLPCGCVQDSSKVVVTYTIQPHDTLSDIGALLSADVDSIVGMNNPPIKDSDNIYAGWVLLIPKVINGLPHPKAGPAPASAPKKRKWTIIISILATVALISMLTVIIILRRNQLRRDGCEDPKAAVTKSFSANKASSFQNQFLQKGNSADVPAFESERPLVYSLEEIENATDNFDESKKIGEGGYGSVYFGAMGKQEVAIKKMRSNKSKEFFAELKVLCKVHHINVVELIGYASGEDHLYLVYEFIPNGSLSEHLHDPLLKGHQPLSWTARTEIALDAARGIEYIHDHTKARYVHRDIKTTNILLDEGLRAKVSDFGLAKLVGRTNDEDLIATRLVGTPGYLPPESVKELQVTPKTDVFAYGVVLAELITGQRALIRDNREPTKLISLITIMNKIFQDDDPISALEAYVDGNLRGNYPMEEAYKMAEIAEWCLSEDPVDRPEMREIVVTLSQIMASSVEWEASLGGNSPVFSGLYNGR